MSSHKSDKKDSKKTKHTRKESEINMVQTTELK